MPNRKPERAFPFPFAEDEAQTRWWTTVPPVYQRLWFPILSAMTPGERQEFHAERRQKAATRGLGDPARMWNRHAERDEEERVRLYWAQRVRARAHSEAQRATP